MMCNFQILYILDHIWNWYVHDIKATDIKGQHWRQFHCTKSRAVINFYGTEICLYFFWFDHSLGARAEICQIFSLVKILFWNHLTFRKVTKSWRSAMTVVSVGYEPHWNSNPKRLASSCRNSWSRFPNNCAAWNKHVGQIFS